MQRAPRTWKDTPTRFGLISMGLHWLMALLLIWQFGCLLVKVLGGPFSWGLHKEVGLVLMVLILIRGVWALMNLKKRPSYAGFTPTVRKLAIGGHTLMYLLMIVIPAIALLRQFGSGRAFSFFGIPITENTGVQVQWMIAPASALHSWLGWLLLLLVVGHISMALIHHFVWKDGLINRMR